jgi:hypothetical protein
VGVRCPERRFRDVGCVMKGAFMSLGYLIAPLMTVGLS